jgi:hypothetical protein
LHQDQEPGDKRQPDTLAVKQAPRDCHAGKQREEDGADPADTLAIQAGPEVVHEQDSDGTAYQRNRQRGLRRCKAKETH